MKLETERLILERLCAEHAQFGFRLYGDPRVNRYLGGSPPEAIEDEIAAIARHAERSWDVYDHGLMAVFLKSDGSFVGICGLLHWDLDGKEETEVAYALVPEQWGHGYATEAARALAEDAFTRLGRERVISLILPDNAASIKVALKNGMTFERRTRLFEKDVNLYSRVR